MQEEILEIVKVLERVRGKTSDFDTVELCDRILRFLQRESMTLRSVSLEEQGRVLQPIMRVIGRKN